MTNLGEHFGNDARHRRTEASRRRQWFIKARQDKARQEELSEAAEATATAAIVSVAIATEIQINQFKVKLERYDAAVTEALLENDERIQFIRDRILRTEQRIQKMLDQAYVLEDGRRIFKGEDGSYVIDEHGNDVLPDEVEFDLVTGPTAEDYTSATDQLAKDRQELDRLLEERKQLHKAQDLIREKQDALEIGETTEQDLEEFDNEIFEALPPSARAKLPENMNPIPNAPDLASSFKIPARPNDSLRQSPTSIPEFSPNG